MGAARQPLPRAGAAAAPRVSVEYRFPFQFFSRDFSINFVGRSGRSRVTLLRLTALDRGVGGRRLALALVRRKISASYSRPTESGLNKEPHP